MDEKPIIPNFRKKVISLIVFCILKKKQIEVFAVIDIPVWLLRVYLSIQDSCNQWSMTFHHRTTRKHQFFHVLGINWSISKSRLKLSLWDNLCNWIIANRSENLHKRIYASILYEISYRQKKPSVSSTSMKFEIYIFDFQKFLVYFVEMEKFFGYFRGDKISYWLVSFIYCIVNGLEENAVIG